MTRPDDINPPEFIETNDRFFKDEQPNKWQELAKEIAVIIFFLILIIWLLHHGQANNAGV